MKLKNNPLLAFVLFFLSFFAQGLWAEVCPENKSLVYLTLGLPLGLATIITFFMFLYITFHWFIDLIHGKENEKTDS